MRSSRQRAAGSNGVLAKPRDESSSPGGHSNMNHPPLFLIGYRGTGKTTTARSLGERLSWSWHDADAVLEERFGQSIRDIFANEGEASFRDKESAVLGD